MESKNILLFVFIFLINTKILVCSENYGYISLTSYSPISTNSNFKEENVEINCIFPKCNISFKNNFNNFTFFLKMLFKTPQ